MKFETIICGLSVLGFACAAPIYRHQHKREQTTYVTAVSTETAVVEVTENAAETQAASSSSSAAASTTSSSSSASSSGSASSSSPVASGSSTAGSPYFSGLGVTYSPYKNDGSPFSADDVKNDFGKLTDYTVIRLYDVEGNQVQYSLQAKLKNQKLLVGIFGLDGGFDASVESLITQVKAGGSWDDIIAVTIGNELISAGTSASSVKSYIEKARSALTQAGYSGKITTVDTHQYFIDNSENCGVGDFVAINAHAYYTAGSTADQAGNWLEDELNKVASACKVSVSDILITESGYPHQGQSNGNQVASPLNQKAALDSIKSKVSNNLFLFTAFDPLWKLPGLYSVEQYYGFISR